MEKTYISHMTIEVHICINFKELKMKKNKKIPLNFMVINGLDYPYSSLDLPW